MTPTPQKLKNAWNPHPEKHPKPQPARIRQGQQRNYLEPPLPLKPLSTIVGNEVSGFDAAL
jgi:hypothetical protein